MKHGCCRSKTEGRTPEYMVWQAMVQRCCNPKCKIFHRYGGRGIRLCERWRSFAAFIEDMGQRPSPEHSIDRINNDGDYEPTNCRWATRAEQRANTRVNRWVSYQGQRMTVKQAADAAGLRPKTAQSRLKRGWSEERAFSPVKIGARFAPEKAQLVREHLERVERVRKARKERCT